MYMDGTFGLAPLCNNRWTMSHRFILQARQSGVKPLLWQVLLMKATISELRNNSSMSYVLERPDAMAEQSASIMYQEDCV
jgi:hypothetical protein